MDDFVGPNRFQWSERMLKVASSVRGALSKQYLRNLRDHATYLSAQLYRPDPKEVEAGDPSEAVDSERILDSINEYFPNAEVVKTGGTIYHLALADILHNFNEEKDRTLLEFLMIIDDLCAELGEDHYATALAIKE
ncbi:hypothetical protein KKB18_09315 [bacterium]|nr:hypothetical protein [bacterium]